MEKDRRLEGKKGELEAERFLRKKGYRIIERNFQCPLGEIDIVAEDEGTLVFVEVKKRNYPFFGISLEAVSERKREKMIKTALFYMKKRKELQRRIRFDVIGIDGEKISLIKNAFGVEI